MILLRRSLLFLLATLLAPFDNDVDDVGAVLSECHFGD